MAWRTGPVRVPQSRTSTQDHARIDRPLIRGPPGLAWPMATVGDLMSRELVRVARDDSIEDAAERMSGRRVGSALVFDGERLVGILTERDVLRVVGARELAGAKVGDWMTSHPETVGAEETAEQAGVLML